MSANCCWVSSEPPAAERAPGVPRDCFLPKRSGFLAGYEADTKAQCKIGPYPVRYDGNPVSDA